MDDYFFKCSSHLFSFSKGDIFATAFVTTVKEHSFHYTLSIMKNDRKATKIHVREPLADQFVFEAVEQSLRESKTLCTALHIGARTTYPAVVYSI